MKRLILAQVQVDAQGTRSPAVPAACTAWVNLADFPARSRMLVKCVLPDGTAKTAQTIADIVMEQTEDGRERQVEVNDETLTQAQIDGWRTAFSNAGFNVSAFDSDGIVSRYQLLRFILRRLARWQDMPVRELLDGWDAA